MRYHSAAVEKQPVVVTDRESKHVDGVLGEISARDCDSFIVVALREKLFIRLRCGRSLKKALLLVVSPKKVDDAASFLVDLYESYSILDRSAHCIFTYEVDAQLVGKSKSF